MRPPGRNLGALREVLRIRLQPWECEQETVTAARHGVLCSKTARLRGRESPGFAEGVIVLPLSHAVGVSGVQARHVLHARCVSWQDRRQATRGEYGSSQRTSHSRALALNSGKYLCQETVTEERSNLKEGTG
jgi:hypothetical protein